MAWLPACPWCGSGGRQRSCRTRKGSSAGRRERRRGLRRLGWFRRLRLWCRRLWRLGFVGRRRRWRWLVVLWWFRRPRRWCGRRWLWWLWFGGLRRWRWLVGLGRFGGLRGWRWLGWFRGLRGRCWCRGWRLIRWRRRLRGLCRRRGPGGRGWMGDHPRAAAGRDRSARRHLDDHGRRGDRRLHRGGRRNLHRPRNRCGRDGRRHGLDTEEVRGPAPVGIHAQKQADGQARKRCRDRDREPRGVDAHTALRLFASARRHTRDVPTAYCASGRIARAGKERQDDRARGSLGYPGSGSTMRFQALRHRDSIRA